MPLIECVPNFSEGRRADVVTAIVDSIATADIYLLDASSDPDHNRMVVTFAGEPEAVLEAAFQGVATAAQMIDLETHDGEHPRIGAADVVPLVPLRGITLEQVVPYAHRLGRRIAEELNLPVYFYEAAALRPDRRNLAEVRRGGYEALKRSIGADPLRLPDAGPAAVGRAGAVLVGARGPLIAFNVYLETGDVEIARAIAHVIRASGGGLSHVKALGLLVQGQAQISMNLTDFRETSLWRVMDAIRAEAQARGVRVARSELVGLVPQAALFNTALAYLQLPADTRLRVLETRLGEQSGDYRELPFE